MGKEWRTGGEPFVVEAGLVWRAWGKVRSNRGAPGVDGQESDGFEEGLEDDLCKLWDRMSSGSYFPKPVRGVGMPKADGTTRMLGAPTVAGRVAQTVAALVLEADLESIFVDDSYGFRPGRGALGAVAVARDRCREFDWVVDLDIAKFFDTVDHGLLMEALEWRDPPAWVVLFVRRWITAPMVMPGGEGVERRAGTPQGGPISPVLANLFLHVVFDLWMGREFPDVRFERYADDVICRCRTRRRAAGLVEAVTGRLAECGPRAHPDKTKVVCCKDSGRGGGLPPGVVSKFTFLGFEFRARTCRSRATGRLFDRFGPGVDPVELKKMRETVHGWRLHRQVGARPSDIARFVNRRVWAWCGYYGAFRPSELKGLLRQVNAAVLRWMRNKYRRHRPWRRAVRQWEHMVAHHPSWLRHWRIETGLISL
ncbi:MAG: group II intron reverse transcriptase/maturase [Bifidobacteriaceae bacterium]|nr:group II intron reverse transcriptase/maturase [Bifidobacteriaceae bacterium]